MKLFFIVLARDRKHVKEKIRELEELKFPYVIVCGEKMDDPNVVHRPARGKYDAINYGAKFVHKDVELIALNDVDTKIHNFQSMLKYFGNEKVGLVYAPELILEGPQVTFFKIFNPIRERIPLAGSGELSIIRRKIFERIIPIKPCKADDTYILFKTLELGYRTILCKESWAETERTKTPKEEEAYKRRTVTGIYQALSYTKPPAITKASYTAFPLISLAFLVFGKMGYYWAKGSLLGMLDYLRGDKSGFWSPSR